MNKFYTGAVIGQLLYNITGAAVYHTENYYWGLSSVLIVVVVGAALTKISEKMEQ